MRKPNVIAPSVLLLLSLTPAVCRAGQQAKSDLSRGQATGKTGGKSKRRPTKHHPDLCPAVVFVRDVYDRLMRYQSAGVEMAASESGATPKAGDYITFEIRNLWTGPIDKIFDQDVDAVDAMGGEVVNITPHHISEADGPAHAYYGAEWAAAPAAIAGTGGQTLREALLENLPGPGHVETFASYEVTVRLGGKSRTYSAMALFTAEAEPSGRLKGQIFDNVTSEMNTVSADESPAAKAPWKEYVKSQRYRAVAAEIAQIKRSGKPLIPAKAPFGHLPGDDAEEPPPSGCSTAFSVNIVNNSPQGASGTIGTSSGTLPTVTVFIGQQITLSNMNTAPDPNPGYAWTVGGTPVDASGYHPENPPPEPLGGYPLNDLEEAEGALTFYWVAAGSGISVTLEVTDTASNGTQTTVSATAVFNVVAPSVAVSIQPTNPIQIVACNGRGNCAAGACYLQLGTLNVPNKQGIAFGYKVNTSNGAPVVSGDNGNFNFGQVVISDCASVALTPASSGCRSTMTSGLDQVWPYGFDPTVQGGQTATDSPAIPLTGTVPTNGAKASSANTSEGFVMYLFYNPYPGAGEGINGIWVPMVQVSWSWASSTSLNPNGATSGVCSQMFSAPSPSTIAQPAASNVTIGPQGAGLIAPYSGLPQWTQAANASYQPVPCPAPGCTP